MYFFQNYVLDEILKFSKDKNYQDATILCKNGLFHSNSFLLATIFPILKTVLNSMMHIDEPLVISKPNLNKSDLEIFFQCIHQQFEKFSPSKDIQDLLKPVVTPKDEPTEVFNIMDCTDYAAEAEAFINDHTYDVKTDCFDLTDNDDIGKNVEKEEVKKTTSKIKIKG